MTSSTSAQLARLRSLAYPGTGTGEREGPTPSTSSLLQRLPDGGARLLRKIAELEGQERRERERSDASQRAQPQQRSPLPLSSPAAATAPALPPAAVLPLPVRPLPPRPAVIGLSASEAAEWERQRLLSRGGAGNGSRRRGDGHDGAPPPSLSSLSTSSVSSSSSSSLSTDGQPNGAATTSHRPLYCPSSACLSTSLTLPVSSVCALWSRECRPSSLSSSSPLWCSAG